MRHECTACQGRGYHCQAQIQVPGFLAQIGFPQGPQLNLNFPRNVQDGYQAPQGNPYFPTTQGYSPLPSLPSAPPQSQPALQPYSGENPSCCAIVSSLCLALVFVLIFVGILVLISIH